MTPILEVTNLRTYFHGKDGVVPAVDGISFSVEVGQTLSIVGESGCGKSVTALSILQLMPTHAAHIETGSSIRLRGEELLGKTPRQMCEIRGNDIAMIFQDPMTSLNPVMTIGRQLSESFMAHKHLSRKDAWAQSIDMLKKVGIPAPEQRVKEYPHQLSGGMKQRVTDLFIHLPRHECCKAHQRSCGGNVPGACRRIGDKAATVCCATASLYTGVDVRHPHSGYKSKNKACFTQRRCAKPLEPTIGMLFPYTVSIRY